jgi:hypothetical protein
VWLGGSRVRGGKYSLWFTCHYTVQCPSHLRVLHSASNTHTHTHRAAPRFQRLLSHRLDRPPGGAAPSSSSGGTCPFAAATRQAPSTLSSLSRSLPSPPTFFAPTFLRIQTLNQSFPFRLSPLLPLQQSPVSAHLTRIFVLSSSVTPSSRLAHNRLPSL